MEDSEPLHHNNRRSQHCQTSPRKNPYEEYPAIPPLHRNECDTFLDEKQSTSSSKSSSRSRLPKPPSPPNQYPHKYPPAISPPRSLGSLPTVIQQTDTIEHNTFQPRRITHKPQYFTFFGLAYSEPKVFSFGNRHPPRKARRNLFISELRSRSE